MADNSLPTPTGTDPLSRATGWYSGLEPARQNQLWLGVLAAVAIAGAGYWWMTNEPYADVITGSSDQIGEAAAALREEGIPTRFDGIHLSVPMGQYGEALGVIHEARLDHSLVDLGRIPMGVSKDALRWGLLRQREGDLAQSIAQMSGIEAAAVHITPGRESLFGLTDMTPATAAVTLKVSPSAKLSEDTVSAVAALVAGGVERLDPSRVAITDNRGRMWRDGSGKPADRSAVDAVTQAELALKQRIENNIREALQRHVPFETPLSVAAMVKVERTSQQKVARDFNVDKLWEERVVSEDRSREKTTESGGPPGVDGALPERNAEAQDPAGGTNKEESAKSTVHNKTPWEDITTITPAGARVAASVAISLDSKALATLWGTEVDSDAYKANVTKLLEVAKAAMLFQEGTDTIVLEATLPYSEISFVEPPAMTVTEVAATAAPWVPYLLATLALILGFVFIVRPLMARALAPAPRAASVTVGPDGKPAPTPESLEADKLRERIIGSVENFQPIDSLDFNRYVMSEREAAAAVLDDWLKKREG